MFHKKRKEKQQKPKKLRVYTANSRKPAVIAMWLLFLSAVSRLQCIRILLRLIRIPFTKRRLLSAVWRIPAA